MPATPRWSGIASPYGPTYFRQTARWKGKRTNGTAVRGEVLLDIFLVAPGVCGERGEVRSAPSDGYAKSIKVLSQIQALLFYHPQ